MPLQQNVYIVDDDANVRVSLEDLLQAANIPTSSYEGAEALLDSLPQEAAGCILTDLMMQGMSGIELQEELSRRGITLPVIVISGFASTSLAVRVMRNGAVTMLDKPFKERDLLEAVKMAFDRNNAEYERSMRLHSLTPGEKDVLDKVLLGLGNKEIAFDLGIGLRTVEARRQKILRKLGVDSLPGLVQFVLEARNGRQFS